MIFTNTYFELDLSKAVSENTSFQPVRYASDSTHPSWLFLNANNINLMVLQNVGVAHYLKYNMKNKMSLFLPFSINSRSFLLLSTHCLFAYHKALDNVLLFHLTDSPVY